MEHINQVFLFHFFQSLSTILFEDFSQSFLTEYYDNFWTKTKAADAPSLAKYLKNLFLSSLDKSENEELKSNNKVQTRTLYKFMTDLSDTLCAPFMMHFPNVGSRVFEPEVNLKGRSISLKTCSEGNVQANEESNQLLSVCTDSESETDWLEMGTKKSVIESKNGLAEASWLEVNTKKRKGCETEESAGQVKKRKIPLKISEAKNRNPFMQKSPVITFDTKFNLDQFTEKSEIEHYKESIRVNLQNLKENTERLNHILVSNITRINALLLQETNLEETTCDGKCPLHCSLLARAQIVKKAKGRKGKSS